MPPKYECRDASGRLGAISSISERKEFTRCLHGIAMQLLPCRDSQQLRSRPKPLQFSESIMVVNTLLVNGINSEPRHPLISLQFYGDVARHVLNENRIVVRLHCNVPFISPLE